MKREKGFTLIELLAVIVILAIIMVIAVPRILEVINSSKASSWKNSTKLVKKSIELNTSTPDPQTSEYKYTVQDLCSNTSKISEIVDIGDIDVTCNPSNSDYVFDLKGKGQFSGRESTITCNTTGNCSSNIVSNDGDSSSSTTVSYETRFDEDYIAYRWVGADTEGYTEYKKGWLTSLNPEAKVYLRYGPSGRNMADVCGVFSSGTVCMTSSKYNSSYYNSNYSPDDFYISDFEDATTTIENITTTSGLEATGLKGYTLAKSKEMLTKGASSCFYYYYDENSYAGCETNNEYLCIIYKNGSVLCSMLVSNKKLGVYMNGKTFYPN